MQAAVVMVQVAGVSALVRGLQRVDAQREVAAREGVRPHRHAVAQERRPVGSALPRRVEVQQAVGAVVRHPGRLAVPVHHLLRLLQVPVGPHVRAVHAGEQRGRAVLRHQHLLLAVPVRAGLPGCGCGRVSAGGRGGSPQGRVPGRGAVGSTLTVVRDLEADGQALVQVTVMVVQVTGVQPRVGLVHRCGPAESPAVKGAAGPAAPAGPRRGAQAPYRG